MYKYEYIRMKYKGLKGVYVSSKEDGQRDHKTIIEEMGIRGYRFVGALPVTAVGNYSSATEYDLVFEIEY